MTVWAHPPRTLLVFQVRFRSTSERGVHRHGEMIRQVSARCVYRETGRMLPGKSCPSIRNRKIMQKTKTQNESQFFMTEMHYALDVGITSSYQYN